MDKISLQRVQLLHPLLRDEAIAILEECNKALTGKAKVRVTQTRRTFGEQHDLFQLGRTVVNPDGKSKQRPLGYKVTNAKAGDSIHNYALALDFCLIIDGKEASWNDVIDWDNDGISDWLEVVQIFKRHGWAWGGDWSSFIDKPHFEKTFGYSLGDLKAMYSRKEFIKGTEYLDFKPKTKGSTSKYTTTELRFRTGPSTSYAIIKTLPKNKQVLILKTLDNGWSQVHVDGIIGFVSSSYLR